MFRRMGLNILLYGVVVEEGEGLVEKSGEGWKGVVGIGGLLGNLRNFWIILNIRDGQKDV